MTKSEFDKLTKVSISNALYHACAAVTAPFLGFLAIGRLPTVSELYFLASVFLGALLGDLFKRKYTSTKY